MATDRPQPRNAESQFSINEMFFSTTDLRGVIITGNDVFERVSGYSRGELVGAPHSIIRHPEVPKAVFKLLWTYLLAGKPIAAYVKNMSKSGSFYWVLALVTPIKNGYLSVRLKPTSPIFGVISGLYSKVLEHEAEHGMDSAFELLCKSVQAAGFPDYDTFMRTALLAEMKCRDEAMSKDEEQNKEDVVLAGSIGDLFAACRSLEERYRKMFANIDGFISLSAELQNKSKYVLGLAQNIRHLSLNAAVDAARAGTEGLTLAVLARDMGQNSSNSKNQILHLNEMISKISNSLGEAGFRIGSATLQMQMMAYFSQELGVKLGNLSSNDYVDVGEVRSSLRVLVDALLVGQKASVGVLGSLRRDLKLLEDDVVSLLRLVRTLELIHVNGKIESVRLSKDAERFVQLFHKMGKMIDTAKEEFKKFKLMIVMFQDNLDLIAKATTVLPQVLTEACVLIDRLDVTERKMPVADVPHSPTV